MSEDQFEVETINGVLNMNDIPIVRMEDKSKTISRFVLWFAVIFVIAIILVRYAATSIRETKQLKYITAQSLIEERDKLLYGNPPKRILISVNKDNFPSRLSSPILNCLFTFFIVDDSGVLRELATQNWDEDNHAYNIQYELPTGIMELTIRANINLLYAHDWQSTLRSIGIYLFDKNDDVVFKHMQIVDFVGGSSPALTQSGYVHIKFKKMN